MDLRGFRLLMQGVLVLFRFSPGRLIWPILNEPLQWHWLGDQPAQLERPKASECIHDERRAEVLLKLFYLTNLIN